MIQLKVSNKANWLKQHKWFSLLIIIALLITGVFVYEKIALELNKRAFAHARAAIDTVYADIVAQVGQPDNSKRSNTCSRPNQLYGRGRLSCDISITFIYGLNDLDQASTYLKTIQKIITSQRTFKATKPLSIAITTGLVADAQYSDAHDYYSNSGISCEASYWYDTPRQIELDIKDGNKKPLEISLSCTDWARSEYYPKS